MPDVQFEPTIGLEVHAELLTRSKMFCGCAVVDSTQAEPNTAVCEICTGMPGTLPVINQKAVEYALRVALALHCRILPTSLFARKNYFYPDLPKGYQISQYELPLAVDGWLDVFMPEGERRVRIRRVHLEELRVSHNRILENIRRETDAIRESLERIADILKATESGGEEHPPAARS